MSSSERNIIFIYQDFTHFVRKDYETLSKSFRVSKLRSTYKKSPVTFIVVGLAQFFKLFWHIWRSDVIFCWFADYHSFLPALFSRISGKRFFLVLGGYDVTHIRELKYGSFNKRFRGYCARFSMQTATLNLPVARALGEEAKKRVGKIELQVLPTGYDPDIYLPVEEKEDLVLTVSLTSSRQRFLVKGLDRFVELARYLPEYRFALIGIEGKWKQLITDQPVNLAILPPLDHRELISWYGRARFYAQLSRSEGLPNAMCEAMMMGCVPAGLNIGGIPEAIGDAGIMLDQWNPDEMAKQIRSCRDTSTLSVEARERIITLFHISRREKELVELLKRKG